MSSDFNKDILISILEDLTGEKMISGYNFSHNFKHYTEVFDDTDEDNLFLQRLSVYFENLCIATNKPLVFGESFSDKGLHWKKITEKESKDSIFDDYGIETNKYISHLDVSHNVANTIRAILDLMYDDNLLILGGFREDFICNDKYTLELFDKVLMMKNRPNLKLIDKLMEKEYLMTWVNYKEKQCVK